MKYSRFPFLRSFQYAFEGVKYALITQRNIKIHFMIASIVSILAIWLKLSSIEWGILILTITSVIVSELFNTSLEKILDSLSVERNNTSKIAKDISAAAVLFTAIASAIIGTILFLPKLLAKI